MTPTFIPPFWMRPAMVQTFLASLKFRRKAAQFIDAQSEAMILDCGDGVRLQGSLTKNPKEKGLFIFLHGWEGSQNSTYVMSCARFVYERGYSVFRLNFRDHGDSHHLNEEPFHSARLAEVFNGVKLAASFVGDAPAFIVGFSLGGNFALRIVKLCEQAPISNLQHVFAISPAIDPLASSPIIDQKPLIRRYFYKKWTTSMRKKEAAFPKLYDFSDITKEKTVMAMSEKFVTQYSDFESAAHYFNAYKIGEDDLSDTKISTSIIMSGDDPVLNAWDVMDLNISPCVSRIMLKYGGHNGFFRTLHGPTWYDEYIATVLEADTP